MDGKLKDIKTHEKVSVLTFETANGLLDVSVFNDGKPPQLDLEAEYTFETSTNYGRDGRQYTNLKKTHGKYEITPKVGFVPANTIPQKSNFAESKDRRIGRLSCMSSASAIVARMQLADAEKAKKTTLELAKGFEAWVLEVV